VEDTAAGGRLVAWTELTGAGPTTVRVALARVGPRGARILRRRVIGRVKQRYPYSLVAVTRHADLAWALDGRVVAQPHGSRPRTVGRGWERLAFEDDRTLRWRDRRDELRYLDLAPPPLRAGCPVRKRFRLVAETPLVRVTAAHYMFVPWDPVETASVLRACLRDGTDRVIAQGDGFHDSYDRRELAAISGRWVVLRATSGSRYGCGSSMVRVIDPRTAEMAGGTLTPDCGSLLPSREDPLAVTDGGAPAWIKRAGATGEDVLLAPGPEHLAAELDRGPAGSLTGLRAAGASVLWSNAGVPRSTPLD
jgi:hypothetical protein